MNKQKTDFMGYLHEMLMIEFEKSTKNLYESTALIGAASLLMEVKHITDPVEQVKYLCEYQESRNSNLESGWIPWAWLKCCIKEKKITELPREDWVNALFINGAYLEGGPEVSLRFLEKNNLPYSLS